MRTLGRIMVRILSYAWWGINFIREFILNAFLIVLIISGLVLWGLANNAGSPATSTLTDHALKIDLQGVIVDQPARNNQLSRVLARELPGHNSEIHQENSLFDIVKAIRQAKDDTSVTGIVLDLHNFAGGDQPALQYIGKALREFRDKGKPIFAYGENYSQAQYYLASFANKIYLSPQGAVDLHGMATNNLYFKSLLDKLNVSSHVFRVGTYKSAVEPFLRDDMSAAAREADTRWLTQLWNNYLSTVSVNRQLTPQQVFPGAKALLEQLRSKGGNLAAYAMSNKLVDVLDTRSAAEQQFAKTFGQDGKQKVYRNISIYDYKIKPANAGKTPNIAVISASGTIMDGPQSDGNVGSETTALQIRTARIDPAIKAIILRVNSPGGSVSASEQIREELVAAKQAGKPIVVSMGGLAASGGYWISTPADYIIAAPSTLTGSIGIFGVINTVENSLRSVGIYTDGVATSPLADITTTKALPDEVSQLMQLTIENGYHNFISLVATSRHKSEEQIDKIAQGHVWTGSDALQNGLADATGDFDDAVQKARSLAHLSQASLVWVQADPTWVDLLIGQIQASAGDLLPAAVKAWLPAPLAEVFQQVSQQPGLFNTRTDPQNRYAWCLSCGVIS